MFEAGRLSLVEQTSPEIQQASLVARQSGNDIAFWIGIIQAAVALLVGLIQAGVVGWGIRYMIRMGERREQRHAERHEETLEALRQQGDALRQQGDALRTLIGAHRASPNAVHHGSLTKYLMHLQLYCKKVIVMRDSYIP